MKLMTTLLKGIRIEPARNRNLALSNDKDGIFFLNFGRILVQEEVEWKVFL